MAWMCACGGRIKSEPTAGGIATLSPLDPGARPGGLRVYVRDTNPRPSFWAATGGRSGEALSDRHGPVRPGRSALSLIERNRS